MGVPYAEVIGDPIAHSKSPLIHKFWLEKLGLEGDYRAVEVKRDGLADYLSAKRNHSSWRGCNVTIPHKEAVRAFLDEADDHGIGAINCVVPREGRLIGRNTDIAGVNEALPLAMDTTRPVCIIGAGGGARAAIAALASAGIDRFHIIARDQTKGKTMLAALNKEGETYRIDEAEQAMARCAGVINASPLGMTGFPSMPEDALRGLGKVAPRGFVFDMVYTPERTLLLQAAERSQLRLIDGLTMLIGQAAHAFQLFFGAEAPREHEELRKMLTT